jgi:hypothetical protein
VLSGERAYDVALECAGPLVDCIIESGGDSSASEAHVLWMHISDLVDGPRGPRFDAVCQRVAQRFSTEWLATAGRNTRRTQDEVLGRWYQDFNEVVRAVIATA